MGLKPIEEMEHNSKSTTDLYTEAVNYIDWKSVLSRARDLSFNIVDVFSGCGGLSYGFYEVGKRSSIFNIIAAFDMDQDANRTYMRNLGVSPCNIDLGVVKAEDLTKIVRLKESSDKRPLIVVGGPPCQGFSALRRKKSSNDSRNILVERFAEFVVALNPILVVMENVPDLLSEKHKKHFEGFESLLRSAGYKIAAQVLNMASFGVPQERCRAVVIASKASTPELPPVRFKQSCFQTVYDAIGHLPPLKAGQSCSNDPMHVTSKHRPKTVDILRQVPKNGGSRPQGVGPACLDKVAGFTDVYGRLAWDRPAITITARCRTPSCGRFAHPDQDRGFSIREAALLQSFPIDFIFEGPFDDRFKQIGNAVPPLFSLHLAVHTVHLLTDRLYQD